MQKETIPGEQLLFWKDQTANFRDNNDYKRGGSKAQHYPIREDMNEQLPTETSDVRSRHI